MCQEIAWFQKHLIDCDHMYDSKSEVRTNAGCHDNTKMLQLLTLLKIASSHYNAKKRQLTPQLQWLVAKTIQKQQNHNHT